MKVDNSCVRIVTGHYRYGIFVRLTNQSASTIHMVRSASFADSPSRRSHSKHALQKKRPIVLVRSTKWSGVQWEARKPFFVFFCQISASIERWSLGESHLSYSLAACHHKAINNNQREEAEEQRTMQLTRHHHHQNHRPISWRFCAVKQPMFSIWIIRSLIFISSHRHLILPVRVLSAAIITFLFSAH